MVKKIELEKPKSKKYYTYAVAKQKEAKGERIDEIITIDGVKKYGFADADNS